jgi:hypothetical protein
MTRQTKICSSCSQDRFLTEYDKSIKEKDGLSYTCKICKSKYSKEYRAKNKEYFKKHCEVIKNKNLELKKICCSCKEEKQSIYFNKNTSKKDGLSTTCKDCNKKYLKNYYNNNREYFKECAQKYNKENSEELKRKGRKYYEANKEKILEKQKIYNSTRKEQNTQKSYKWRRENRERYLELRGKRKKERYKSDPNYKLKSNMISRTNLALKENKKSGRTEELLGCTIDYLKIYLESKFEEGMNWEERSKWHIDHIRPCSSFDLSNAEQQRLCFHYTNLQPLWATDNIKKSAKILGDISPS